MHENDRAEETKLKKFLEGNNWAFKEEWYKEELNSKSL